MRRKAFTLIELLIVVAIIAILAAIAIPNFIEAQIRSKVSREKANMRSIATALEAYRVDNTHYPPDRWEHMDLATNSGGDNYLHLHVITTPVSYMTSIPDVTFVNKSFSTANDGESIGRNRWYEYEGERAKGYLRGLLVDTHNYPNPPDTGAVWSLTSWGPDLAYSNGHFYVFGMDALHAVPANSLVGYGEVTGGAIYDSTNGSKSTGDIVRIGP